MQNEEISIYSYKLDNNHFLDEFNLQYSYDKDPEKENDYFIIKDNLQVNIYKDDLSFLKGSQTEPRSELRGLTNLKDNIRYSFSWRQNIKKFEVDYWFSFFQIFAKEGPNIMLRWKDNNFELLGLQGRNKPVILKTSLDENLNTWVDWKVDFLLLESGGYIKVYKNSVLVGELMDANTSGQDDSYIKIGIYTQECQTQDMIILLDYLNLKYIK